MALPESVNAVYAVHRDMKSQTGGASFFGQGALHGKSLKQKLKRKSSKETELIGISDYIPFNICFSNFMDGQKYTITSKIMRQENQNAINMKINGKNACTRNKDSST